MHRIPPVPRHPIVLHDGCTRQCCRAAAPRMSRIAEDSHKPLTSSRRLAVMLRLYLTSGVAAVSTERSLQSILRTIPAVSAWSPDMGTALIARNMDSESWNVRTHGRL